MDSNVQSVSTLIVLVLFGIVLTFIYAIPAAIVMWKLYVKASRPGWAAIVPVYSSVVEAQIGKQSAWLGVIAGVLMLFTKDNILISITYLVLGIYLLVKFIKQYQASVGFWIALLLLPIAAAFMVKNVTYLGGGGSTPPASPVAEPIVAATAPVEPTVPPVIPPSVQ